MWWPDGSKEEKKRIFVCIKIPVIFYLFCTNCFEGLMETIDGQETLHLAVKTLDNIDRILFF